MPKDTRPTNRLLAALPKKEFNELRPRLEEFEMVYGDHIYEAHSVIDHVYFPESGIISLLSTVDAHSSIEVGIVGSEGLAGLPVFLGVKRSGNVAVIQVRESPTSRLRFLKHLWAQGYGDSHVYQFSFHSGVAIGRMQSLSSN